MEVSALNIIRNKTTISVPRVWAWGVAASNPLGLGPFIIMDFIDGVNLGDLLEDPNARNAKRPMREDISDGDIEAIYRQFANFMLPALQTRFRPDRQPTVPKYWNRKPHTSTDSPVDIQGTHTILQDGGIDTFGKGFAVFLLCPSFVLGSLIECIS